MKTLGVVVRSLGVVTGILAAGLLLGALVTGRPYSSHVSSNLGSDNHLAAQSSSTGQDLAPTTDGAPPPVSTTSGDSGPQSIAASPLPEDTFEQILSSDESPAAKAKELLQLFPNLPAGAQADAALLACDLVPDKDYGLLERFLTDGAATGPARDILLGNLLERPTAIQVPVLQELARDPRNPEASDADALLALVIEGANDHP